jgi:hypothetical protein
MEELVLEAKANMAQNDKKGTMGDRCIPWHVQKFLPMNTPVSISPRTVYVLRSHYCSNCCIALLWTGAIISSRRKKVYKAELDKLANFKMDLVAQVIKISQLMSFTSPKHLS